MRTSAWRAFASVVVALVAPAPAQEFEFHGRVLGADGQPVAGAPVDTYWAVADDKLVPRAGTRTDAEGRWKLRAQCTPKRPTPILAVDPAVANGAAQPLDPDRAADELVLRLVPMVPVRGEIVSSKLGFPVENCFASIFVDAAVLALVGVNSNGKLALQLPPGNWRVSYHAADCIAVNNRTYTVAADAKEVDLGVIDLAPTVLSQLYGRVPPALVVGDARGVERAVKLEDYRGRWVLLEFWGFW